MKKDLNLTNFKWVILTVFTLFCISAKASHFKGGNMTWEVINEDTVQITITSVWSDHLDESVSPTSSTIQLQELTNEIVSHVAGVKTRIQKYRGIVPIDGQTHRVEYSSCCRVNGLANTQSSSIRFLLFTEINLSNGNMHSPISTVAPIIKVQINDSTAQFQIPVFDGDGDTISFRMATPVELGGEQPTGVAISQTGLVSINTTLPNFQIGQLYAVGAVISDGSSQVYVDFQLLITQPSDPPIFDYTINPNDGHKFSLYPNDSLQFGIKATDPDGDSLAIYMSGNPGGSTLEAQTTLNDSIAQYTFSWDPTIADVGEYIINFIAEDEIGVQTTMTITITIISPEIEDCNSLAIRNGFEWIESITFKDSVVSQTGKNSSGYLDNSSFVLHAETNEQIPLKLVPGYISRKYNEYWKIWIDWNNDGDFGETNELVFQKNGKGNILGHFVIPDQILFNEVKMKIAMSWKKYPPYCGNFTNGEIEIITLKINDTEHDH